MADERSTTSVPEYSGEELEVFGDFFAAARDGRNPDIEKYLSRVPASDGRLRPVLETVRRLCDEVRRLKAAYPRVDLARLLDPKGRARGT